MTIAGTALISLVTAVIVAVLSHIFSVSRSRRDQLAGMRLKAYTDFIEAASKLASARRIGKTSDELEELGKLNDAKARICICGDVAVVEALTEFWQSGATLEEERGVLTFTWLCARMRESLGNKRHDLASLNISQTLFRLEPDAGSYRVEHSKSGGKERG